MPRVTHQQPYSGDMLRRAAWHFLSGKFVSGLLTLAILLTLVRVLEVQEYGGYVTLIAAGELVYGLCGLGFPWVAARYIPEYRLHASLASLRALIWQLLGWQIGMLFAAVVVGLLIQPFLRWTVLDVTMLVSVVWLALILTEGAARFVCEALLAPLLQQGIARSSLIGRQVVFLVALVGIATLDKVSLENVLAFEVAAASIGLLVALVGLKWHLNSLNGTLTSGDDRMLPLRRLWRTALPMYGADLLSLCYSPPVFLMLIQRFLGAEATAAFGFLRSLYEQAARYLPATLLFSVIRPKLVASYVDARSGLELSRNANLAGKISLFVLMPVLAFAAARGEALVTLLSGGRFPHTGSLFLGFMMVLIPLSQRQLLETVAVASGHGTLCMFAAVVGALGIPVGLFAFYIGAGLWAGIAALGIGQLLLVLFLAGSMQRLIGYQPDAGGLLRLIVAAFAGASTAVLLDTGMPPMIDLLITAALVLAVFLVAAWVVKPFTELERRRVNRLIGRSLFVW